MVLWELYWRVLGSSWGSFGGSWDPFGALLGLSWGLLGSSGGPLGAILEAIDQKRGGSIEWPPPWGPQNCLWGPSWGPLGALLGALGAVLGPSWAPLGVLWGHLGTMLRLEKAIGREKARMQKTQFVLSCWSHFGLLGGALGGSKSTQNRLGAVLRPLGGMSEAIPGHLEVSWAILEAILGYLGPSWSHLGRSNPSVPPVQTQGGGEVNLPE